MAKRVIDEIQAGRMELERIKLDATNKLKAIQLQTQMRVEQQKTKLQQRLQDLAVAGQEAKQKRMEAAAEAEGGGLPTAQEIPPPMPTRALRGIPTGVDPEAIAQNLMQNPSAVQGGAAVQAGGEEEGVQIPGLSDIPSHLTTTRQQTGIQFLPGISTTTPVEVTTTARETRPNALSPRDVLALRLQQEQDKAMVNARDRRIAIQAYRATLDHDRTLASLKVADARIAKMGQEQQTAFLDQKVKLFDLMAKETDQVTRIVDREAEPLTHALVEMHLSGKPVQVGPEGQLNLEPGNPASAILRDLSQKYAGTPLLEEIFNRSISQMRSTVNEQVATQQRMNDPSKLAAITQAEEALQTSPPGSPQRLAAERYLLGLSGNGTYIKLPDGTVVRQGTKSPASLQLATRGKIANIDNALNTLDGIFTRLEENPDLLGPGGVAAKILNRVVGSARGVADLFGGRDAFNAELGKFQSEVQNQIAAGNMDPDVLGLLDTERLGELQVLENWMAIQLADAFFEERLSAQAVDRAEKMTPDFASMQDPRTIKAGLDTVALLLKQKRQSLVRVAQETGITIQDAEATPGVGQGSINPRTGTTPKSKPLTADDLKKLLEEGN
jgi:hypothetical protein